MKLIKINDDLSINLESIYSISKQNVKLKNTEFAAWKVKFDEILKQYQTAPPTLSIDVEVNEIASTTGEPVNFIDTIQFNPLNVKNNKTKEYKAYLNSYLNKLHDKILNEIGTPPEENIIKIKYYVLLVTGVKVNIDKIIYDKLTNLKDIYIE